MILYSLCLHPFLVSLEKSLPGIPIRRQVHSSINVYADDVTFFVSNPEDFLKISEAIGNYELA